MPPTAVAKLAVRFHAHATDRRVVCGGAPVRLATDRARVRPGNSCPIHTSPFNLCSSHAVFLQTEQANVPSNSRGRSVPKQAAFLAAQVFVFRSGF